MARQGHVPIRTCVVCGKKGPKYTLVRMALDAMEKSVVLDRNQGLEGRGAYACSGCLPRLQFSRRVQKAFRGKASGLAHENLPPGQEEPIDSGRQQDVNPPVRRNREERSIGSYDDRSTEREGVEITNTEEATRRSVTRGKVS